MSSVRVVPPISQRILGKPWAILGRSISQCPSSCDEFTKAFLFLTSFGSNILAEWRDIIFLRRDIIFLRRKEIGSLEAWGDGMWGEGEPLYSILEVIMW